MYKCKTRNDKNNVKCDLKKCNVFFKNLDKNNVKKPK